jgi:hypothetical protein
VTDTADKLTLEQLAAGARCSVRTVARAIQLNELAVVREHGRTMTTRSEAQRWIAARKVRSRRASHVERAIAAELHAVAEVL